MSTSTATALPTAGSAWAKKREIASLTGLRAIGALWVVLFHWSFTPGPEFDWFKRTFAVVVHSGFLGVDLFYGISGFVIAYTYLDRIGQRLTLRGSGRFLWARICRVWPVYMLMTVLFGLWLVYRHYGVGDEHYAFQTVQPDLGWLSWVRQVFMVQLWTQPFLDGSSFIGAAWSISAEWLAYVVFPLLALLLFRVRRLPWWVLAVLALICVLPAARRVYGTGEEYFPYSWLVRILTEFTAGALVCLAVQRIRRTERVIRIADRLAVITVLEIVLVLVWAGTRNASDPGYGAYGVAAVLFPVLIGALALGERGVTGFLSKSWMVHGGRISYSLYLVHIPVLEIFWTWQREHPWLAPGTHLVGWIVPNLILVCLLLAQVLWKYVEEPARRRMRRWVR